MDRFGTKLSEGPAVFPRSTNVPLGGHLLSFDCSSDRAESPLNGPANGCIEEILGGNRLALRKGIMGRKKRRRALILCFRDFPWNRQKI